MFARRAIASITGGLFLVLPLLGVASASAMAPTRNDVEHAVAELKAKPPIYSDPAAPLAIDDAQIVEVTASIAAAQTPIFIAIVPNTGGKASDVARKLHRGLGEPGTYVGVSGTAYGTFSTDLDAQPLLTRAFAEERAHGTAAVLTRFSQLVGEQVRDPAPAEPPFPWAAILVVLIGAVVFIGIILLMRGRNEEDGNGAAPLVEDVHPAGRLGD